MEYRQLGRWGLRVSRIGLGSYLTIGHHVDDRVADTIVRQAYDAGVNFFDTANVYNRGDAECALGRLLSGFRRDSFVLATKVWGPMGDGPNDRGLSRKHIFEQCEASLKRLGTHYIDLYQCHRYDTGTPLEETIQTLDDLIRQGKILYWGVSEWTAAQIAAADDYCRKWGLRTLVSNQPRYSLLWREPEKEVFPQAQEKGIGQVVFSPLAHGVLTGKYKPGVPPPQGTRAADDTQNQIMMALYFRDDNLRRVERMGELARSLGLTTTQLAIAWLLRNSAVSNVIAGVTHPEQLAEILGVPDACLPDEAAQALDALFPIQLVPPAAP